VALAGEAKTQDFGRSEGVCAATRRVFSFSAFHGAGNPFFPAPITENSPRAILSRRRIDR
jgi:hypothetical protein